MNAGRWLCLLAVVGLVLGPPGVVAPAGATGHADPFQADIADTTVLAAEVGPDGDADWRVTYRIRLDDANDTEAFESLRADIEADPDTYVAQFRDRIERTVADAENATGRGMSATNVSVETRTETQPDAEFGVVTYRFEWRGFAAVDGDRLTAGDAVAGLFLDPDTALRLEWPADYGVVSASPDPDELEATAAVWRGQRDFGADEPRLTVAPGAAAPTETPGGADGGDGAGGGSGTALLVAAVVVAAALAGGGLLLARRQDSGSGPGPTGGAGGDGGATAAGGAGAGAADEGAGTPPEELLSNEERVLRLLEENGGRMKQKEVADRLDWTAAKTSQVVGDLRDGGDLESFRLGRENVLTLPDVEVDPGPDDEG